MPVAVWWLGAALAGGWAVGKAGDAAEDATDLAKWAAIIAALWMVSQAMKGR